MSSCWRSDAVIGGAYRLHVGMVDIHGILGNDRRRLTVGLG